MFMLYGVALGLLAGALLRGRPGRLAELELRWVPAALVGLVVQLALFSPLVAPLIGSLGPLIYVASTALVLVFVLVNLRIPGFLLVALGAASNLAAIVANGGYMPASAEALAALGIALPDGYTNSSAPAAPALRPLTDLFAMPSWMPFANVFSVGDVLVALGVAVAIAHTMTRGVAGARRNIPRTERSTSTTEPLSA